MAMANAADGLSPSNENTINYDGIRMGLRNLAMSVIEVRRRQSQGLEEALEWFKKVTDVAQELCSLLDKAPLGASIGAKALGAAFEQLGDALALGPAVSMLVLDVILVYELLTRLWQLRKDATPESAERDAAAMRDEVGGQTVTGGRFRQVAAWVQGLFRRSRRKAGGAGEVLQAGACGNPAAAPLLGGGGGGGARHSGPVSTAAAVAASSDGAGARGRGAPARDGEDEAAVLRAAGEVIMGNYAVTRTAGEVHAALLRLALDEATALIGATRRRSGMICMAVNAGQMLEDVKAAAEFLSSARERFCESVTTGKVFGEYAAEGITQLRAVQRGEMAEGGSILLCSGRQRGQAVKAKLFKVDAETSAMSKEVLDRLAGGGGPPDRTCWQAVLGSQPRCMAVTSSKLEQCSRDSKQLFLIWKGGSGGDLAAALCLCQQHGTGYRDDGLLMMQTLANGYIAKHVFPCAPPLTELDFTELSGAASGSAAGSSGAADGGAGGAPPFNNCRAVFRMTVEQLRRVRDGGGPSSWDVLCKRLRSSADAKHFCARCGTAPPKSIWADTSGAPGAPSYRMLVVCGNCRKGKNPKGKPTSWVELHYSADTFTEEQKDTAWNHLLRLCGDASSGR